MNSCILRADSRSNLDAKSKIVAFMDPGIIFSKLSSICMALLAAREI